jgi:hypothetical protein
MGERPAPGTNVHDIYQRLLPAMSRAGRSVGLDGCASLAAAIQQHGRRSRAVGRMARALGPGPRYLPRKRKKEGR